MEQVSDGNPTTKDWQADCQGISHNLDQADKQVWEHGIEVWEKFKDVGT